MRKETVTVKIDSLLIETLALLKQNELHPHVICTIYTAPLIKKKDPFLVVIPVPGSRLGL